MQIEHIIGILAALQYARVHFVDATPETIEKLAMLLWKQLEQTCKKYESQTAKETAESARAHNKKSNHWIRVLPQYSS
jgi:hypothetical protein